MSESRWPWVLLFLLGLAGLSWRAVTTGMGSRYVRAEVVQPAGSDISWTRYTAAPPRARNEPGVVRSWPRTIGVWLAAFLTLSSFSFLYGDNAFYKLAQALIVGVSAGFAVVVGFWTMLVPNLLGNLVPNLTTAWALPDLQGHPRNLVYIVPLILSFMMWSRLLPSGGWISRWPLAFFIGLTAGLKLVTFFKADFVDQINNTILPVLVIYGGDVDLVKSLKNTVLLVSVVSCLVYFFFSLEHSGVTGKVSRLGIYVLMITFGAAFGSTVMGRISLLASRLQFLFDDWLWLIDPLGLR
jgi:hypothetical protein